MGAGEWGLPSGALLEALGGGIFGLGWVLYFYERYARGRDQMKWLELVIQLRVLLETMSDALKEQAKNHNAESR